MAVELKVKGSPQAQNMSDGEGIKGMFSSHQNLLVKQTMRGCLQECFGCEAKSEFVIAPLDWKELQGYKVTEEALKTPDIMYALEESNCLCRLCWRDGRAFDMLVTEGGGGLKETPRGKELVHFVKPLGCPLKFSIPTENGNIDCPCCCCLPKVNTILPDGTDLKSESRYMCTPFCFVPILRYSENDTPVYTVKPETCCGGCCIACNCCNGKGIIGIPFYFHEPETGKIIGQHPYGNDAPQIRKVWGGLKKECCSTADTFAVKFPDGITPERKAGLLGMTFLIDFTVFERQNEN